MVNTTTKKYVIPHKERFIKDIMEEFDVTRNMVEVNLPQWSHTTYGRWLLLSYTIEDLADNVGANLPKTIKNAESAINEFRVKLINVIGNRGL